MALLDALAGATFIVDAFNVGDIFLQLRITHRSISLQFQHTALHSAELCVVLNRQLSEGLLLCLCGVHIL